MIGALWYLTMNHWWNLWVINCWI